MKLFSSRWLLTAILNLAFAPAWAATTTTFNSPPTVSHNPAYLGEKLTFTASATSPNANPVTYSWNFGDGSFTSGASVTHAYAATGNYTVSVSADAGQGTSSSAGISLTVKNTLVGTGPDADGDGFSDAAEELVRANPNSAFSTPLGGQQPNPLALLGLKVTKASIKLHFDKKGSNEIKMSGVIMAADGLNLANQKFVIAVGHAVVPFTLDKHGKAKTGKYAKFSVALKGKAPKAPKSREATAVGPGVTEYNWNLDIKQPKETPEPVPNPFPPQPPPDDAPPGFFDVPPFITLGDLIEALQVFGLIDDDIGIPTSGGLLGVPVDVPIMFLCPFCVIEVIQELDYTAKKGKSGQAVPYRFD